METTTSEAAVLELLVRIYGPTDAQRCLRMIQKKLAGYHFQPDVKKRNFDLTEQDVFLIAYGDIVSEQGRPPLQTLAAVLERYLNGTFSHLHILPFYPYTSDDGFSVVDYKSVDERLGSWEDITALSKRWQLMFDAVVNHVSASSRWFTECLKGNGDYSGYFIEGDPAADYSMVTRPRTMPLFTPFQLAGSTKYFWTTFSADQIDLNYRSVELTVEVLDVLFAYLAKGAKVIRLDAVSYMWKEMNTSCCNLEKTHLLIQLIRAVLDMVAPEVIMVTETNVPHNENIKYFGNGYNEAQMVYQFALPPLVAYSFFKGSAEKLSHWAVTLDTTGDTTFFNFLSSHDGVGVIPVSGMVAPEEIDELAKMLELRGGFVSKKSVAGNGTIPYELNSTYYSLLCDNSDPEWLNQNKFISAHAILASMRGVPAFYYHSMLGSQNNTEEAVQTGQNRTVNRKKFTLSELDTLLQAGTASSKIMERLKALIAVRKGQKAFHPLARQEILMLAPALFSFLRYGADGSCILSVTNTSGEWVTVHYDTGAGCLLASSPEFELTAAGFRVPPCGFGWIKLTEGRAHGDETL